jgi:hypothetical protein
MHIDKKSDINEENYISCILDDNSTEIPPVGGTTHSEAIKNSAETKTPDNEIMTSENTAAVVLEKKYLVKFYFNKLEILFDFIVTV